MKRLVLAVGILCMVLTSQVFAEGELGLLEGLNFRVGVNHISGHAIVVCAPKDKYNTNGLSQDQAREPDNFAGFSLGAEYFLRLPSHHGFEFGLGVEHNVKQTFEKYYQNNSNDIRYGPSLKRDTFDLSSTSVYLAGKYHFPTRSTLQPYILARVGYSFPKWDDYVNYRRFDGDPAGETEIPVDIQEVKQAPYVGIGFGVTFKEHFFIEPVYTYSRLRYQLYVDTTKNTGAYPAETLDYIAQEKHDAQHHVFYINMGYNFGSHTVSERQSVSPEEERSLLSGLKILLGVNKSFPMNSDYYRHENSELLNEFNEVAASEQNGFADIPKDAVTFSMGAEYLYPFSKTFQAGIGIEYNAENTYVEDKLTASESLNTAPNNTYEQDFSNIALYAAAKYHFDVISQLKPYVLARLGYSFNEWEFRRNTFGNDLDMKGSQSIDDGLYFGTGFGIQLSKHLSAEAVYSVTQTETDAEYDGVVRFVNGLSSQIDHKESTIQALHFMLSFNL